MFSINSTSFIPLFLCLLVRGTKKIGNKMMPLFRMDVVLLQQPVWGKKYMNKKVFLEVDITKFIFLTC